MSSFSVKENIDLDLNGNPTTGKNIAPISGQIIPFAGTTAPSGWAICDGLNGTPDLRGYFLLGARSSTNIGGTYGAATHTHTYSFDSFSFGNVGESHGGVDTGFDGASGGDHGHSAGTTYGSGSGANNLLANASSGGGPIAFVNKPHSHNGYGTTGYNNANHNTHAHYDGGASESSRVHAHDTAHSLTSNPTGNLGSSSSYQPFIIMNYIMKL